MLRIVKVTDIPSKKEIERREERYSLIARREGTHNQEADRVGEKSAGSDFVAGRQGRSRNLRQPMEIYWLREFPACFVVVCECSSPNYI